MSLLKRHRGRRRSVGRRVAGVAVGAALLMVGLEAPAFAVAPTVTGFSPTSGPAGCVVQITGTSFTNPAVTEVKFGTQIADFQIVSDTEIWATSPGGAGSSGFITVTNGDGAGSSLVGWVNNNPGTCSPTITSVAPACGPAGTEVTITGTNLLEGVSPADGADVYFGSTTTANSGTLAMPIGTPTLTEVKVLVPAGSPATLSGPIAVATFNNTIGQGGVFATTPFAVGTCITEVSPTSGNVGSMVTITGVGFDNVTGVQFFNGVPALFTLATNTNTTDTITTTVPIGAATGPITLLTVDAPNGTSVQSAEFTVGPGTGGPTHERSVTLRLRRHLIARGRVTVGDGFDACAESVRVKIQRRASGGWRTVRFTTTTSEGRYAKRLPDRPGRYRAVAPRVVLDGEDVCLKDVSPRQRHRH